jgi:hypothetical protein
MWPENTEFWSEFPKEPTWSTHPWISFYSRCAEVQAYGTGQVTVDTVIHGPPETIVSSDVELIDLTQVPMRIRGRTSANGNFVFTGLPVGREYIAVAYDGNGEFNPPAARVVAVPSSDPEEPA